MQQLVERVGKSNMKNKFSMDILRQGTLVVVLLLEIILFSQFSNNFFETSNLINILRQISITGISAVGMFMILLLGDIDLSVGAVYALVGVICALLFKRTGSTVLILVIAILIGVAIGLFNGIVTAKGKIPAFVTTLATMSICRGIAYIITGGTPIGMVDRGFTVFGAGYVFGYIPIPIIIMIIIVVLGIFITGYTRFGRRIYASGGNEQSARYSGIKTDNIKIAVFTIAGVLYGLSGLILAGRLGGGLPAAGNGSEMDVITVAVLGGTSMSGGKGKLWSVMLAVAVLGVLSTGLTMMGVSSYWQQVIKGIIILAAVLFDTKAGKNE